MSDFAVTVEQIIVLPHDNADNLEVAHVADYQCIVKKGEFHDGDLVAYIPEGALVPDTLLQEMGLAGRLAGSEKNRVKAIKLRGVLSQGLVYPAKEGWKEGDDVTELLGITKYEPPIPERFSGIRYFAGYDRTIKYDIENVKKYPRLIEPGEEVVFTEKIHGCVPHYARIRMANGTNKPLAKTKIGEYVLGINEHGQLVPSKILNKFSTGKSDKWLRIKGKRYGAGKGNSYFSLTCTPNHKIWVENKQKYVSAEQLEVGDEVLNFRTNWNITPLQKSILLGKLLGDGHLISGHLLSAVSWAHKSADRDYVDFTAKCLTNLVQTKPSHAISGYGIPMVRQRTVGNTHIFKEFSSFKTHKRKIVPEWVASALDPIAIAFWYMDDGSLTTHAGQEDRANFAVCNFSKQDCEVLQRGLQKFGITAVYYQDTDGYSRLRLNSDDAERLFLLISPYVPVCMQRKLPGRYRGGPGWMPSDRQYKNPIVKQTISSIEDVTSTVKSIKWDLTTETHNFFAFDILVHNSWTMFCRVPDRWAHKDEGCFVVSSKGIAAQGLAFKLSSDENDENVYVRVAKKFNIEERIINAFERDLCTSPVFVLGETYGVQDLKYGASSKSDEELGFRIFDVYVGKPGTGHFLDDAELELACQSMALERVPVLYRGPYWHSKLQEYTDGLETVSGKALHIREGIVIRPRIERTDSTIGRVQLKSVSESYLLRKGETTELQ